MNCPGRYCGILETSTLEFECSACPVGFRTNSSKYCTKCTNNPSLYEWMYLGNMFFVPLLLNFLFIGIHLSKTRGALLWQAFSAFVEAILAVIFSLLLFEPKGSLKLISCKVIYLSDWYTVFYNPSIKYTQTLYCAQEAVYPLYSIVFVCYLFSLLLMIILRPLLTFLLIKDSNVKKQCRKLTYAAMYFHPILVVIHAILAGLIYYSFPYLIIAAALLLVTTYAVTFKLLNIKKLLKRNWMRHWLVITWHLAMLLYASIAIFSSLQSVDIAHRLPMLPLILVPIIFLFATEKMSSPRCIDEQVVI